MSLQLVLKLLELCSITKRAEPSHKQLGSFTVLVPRLLTLGLRPGNQLVNVDRERGYTYLRD